VSGTAALIAGCALATIAIKAAGPVAFGGRALPPWSARVIALLVPAVLAALVVTQSLTDGQRLAVGAHTVGVLAGGLVAWRTRSTIACVVVAAALTAALRAL
jgi:branched-subunit amino acid transport protein